MAKHEVMDRSGHSTVEFDKLDPAQREAANKRFMELIGQGYIAATRAAGSRDYDVIKDPAKQLDETLFRPQNVGG